MNTANDISPLSDLPPLYKKPSCYYDRERDEFVAIVFHENTAGKEAFKVIGSGARAIANFVIKAHADAMFVERVKEKK